MTRNIYDPHTATIRACLQALSWHLGGASHEVKVALEADSDNEAIGSIIHLQDRLNLALNLYNAAISAHRLGKET